jgi:hypothetical protein
VETGGYRNHEMLDIISFYYIFQESLLFYIPQLVQALRFDTVKFLSLYHSIPQYILNEVQASKYIFDWNFIYTVLYTDPHSTLKLL